MIGRFIRAGTFQSLGRYSKVVMTLLAGAFLLNSYIIRACGRVEIAELLALVAVVLAGGPIVAGAVQGLSERRGNVDELVSLALIACLVLARFEAAATVAFLMQLGTLLEELVASRARAGIARLIQLQPEVATVRRDGREQTVSVDSLQPGETMILRPGEKLGADGVVSWGHSWIDQSAITGEGIPVEKQVGDRVFAGTLNGQGALEVRIAEAGCDTTLARIVGLVEDAEGQQAPIVRVADEFAGFFTPVVLTIAVVVYLATGEILRAVSVLIVGCPCALIFATPTAIMAAIAAACRQGVLIKSGAVLEEAAKVDTVFFDKTGTLTAAKTDLVDVQSDSDRTPEEIFLLAAVAEKLSNHPLGGVLLAHAAQRETEVPSPDKFTYAPGQGVEAEWDGSQIVVGRPEFVREKVTEAPPTWTESAPSETTLYVAADGEAVGRVCFTDPPRPGADHAVAALRRAGIGRVVILTGDKLELGEQIRAATGADEVRAELLPEQKLDVVTESQNAGYRVAVVGDGVNDAPALAAANVGIAMGTTGTAAALETADVALTDDRLDRLPFLILLANRTRRTIKQGLALAVCINVAAVVVSAMGWLLPIPAAVVHNVGSVLVVLNSSRLIAGRPEKWSGMPAEPTGVHGGTG